MAGNVARRLVVEIDEDDTVRIDGFGWDSTGVGEDREVLWLGGDAPTLVLLARQDQLDAPQVVANEVWELDKLLAILRSTAKLAREVATDPSDPS